jgi:hypothetical protein
VEKIPPVLLKNERILAFYEETGYNNEKRFDGRLICG